MRKRLKPRSPVPPSLEMDRRLRVRYAIEQDVRYRVIQNRQCLGSGSGRTRNLSSCGVWFTTEQMLQAGQSVELTVDWPAPDDLHPLKLMLYGTVMRAGEGGAALAIRRYQFRQQDSEPRISANSFLRSQLH